MSIFIPRIMHDTLWQSIFNCDRQSKLKAGKKRGEVRIRERLSADESIKCHFVSGQTY